MKAKKVLFINQEITPYVDESPMATLGRKLPQAIQDCGHEIRTFLPKWGNINERRNQLHEVIRLSGMNIIIDDTDHPLIIKVASIPVARMQVYFIDNDDYFHKRLMAFNKDGKEYEDNAERAIFYARGVLETVKKLRWCPDIIHCQGWISSIVPIYIKTAFKDEPTFRDSKVVFSLYNEMFETKLSEDICNTIQFKDANKVELEKNNLDFTSFNDLTKLAISYSDGIIQAEEGIDESLLQYVKDSGKKTLEYPGEEINAEIYSQFYKDICQ